MVVDDPKTGSFKYKRSIFTDEALFELEMKHIFEGNWIFLAHESQISQVNDYFSAYIGRQPIFISRNKQGELNAFMNACRLSCKRGALELRCYDESPQNGGV
jgi:benzoate/toluate 1,2-dioxygenase subunit alpha